MFISGTLLALSILFLVPALVFFVEIAASFLGKPRIKEHGPERRPRIAVLIPAHNEALGIAETLATIRPQLQSGDRVLVVADNCSDNTDEVAAASGAEVISRSDLLRRGKGYALDFGVRYLETDPPEIVIVVDADCLLGPNAIPIIACACFAVRRPAQALYLMRLAADADPKSRIAQFAFTVKNLARPLGLDALGLPCQLMGTGMAFTWACIRAAPLATGHIVEDLKLGLDLARADLPPVFCPDATVTSSFAATPEGSATQRTRWEHGHLGIILAEAPALLWEAVRSRRVMLGAMALDLSVPPLSLLILTSCMLCLVDVIAWYFLGILFPIGVASLGCLLLFGATLAAWAKYGRQTLTLSTLLYGFAYAARKLPLYVKFIVERQVDWVRSRRDSE
jgi:cellulose synthase/poly-beta-1,6-N-acetylglucosamine synthase-like glycosyltransferase